MDENNIISYKPDLNIYGNTTTAIKGNGGISATVSDNIKFEENINTNKSISLKNFIYYSPFNCVDNIENLLKYLEDKLTNVENNLSNNMYENKYFAAQGEEETEKQILKENNCDAEYGSNVLEAYSYMKTIYDDLNAILSIYMECLFGKNVDTSEVKKIIDTYINKIEGYEAREEYKKINYVSLYYDSKVSYILSDYLAQLDNICYDLSCIRNNVGNNQLDSKAYNLIKKYFDKENNVLDASLYSCGNCKDNICIAIKNLYLEKQELLDNLNAFDDIYNISKELYTEITKDSYAKINSNVSNLIKSCMNYNLNYGDVTESVKKKSEFRNFL